MRGRGASTNPTEVACVREEKVMQVGEKVSWMTINGPKNGEVEGNQGEYIIIHLDNGKTIVADLRSLRKEEQCKG